MTGPYPAPELDWHRSQIVELMCPGCREQKMVHQIEDCRGIQATCDVCAWSWWIKGPLADSITRAGRGYRRPEFDISKNLIDGP